MKPFLFKILQVFFLISKGFDNFFLTRELQNGVKKNQHQESHQRETMHDKFVGLLFGKLVMQKIQ